MFSKMTNSHYNAVIEPLVNKIKNNVIKNNCSIIISPSAYDIAWVAMIDDPTANYMKPMFNSCLDWILNNQDLDGFWGERDCHGNPTIDSLPATLACVFALKTWNVGHNSIKRGMSFIRANTRKLVERKENNDKFPRWFAIVFPGMVELAHRTNLPLVFDNNDAINEVVFSIFRQRQEILNRENLVDKYQYSPLLSYLEVLPSSYEIDETTIINNLSSDGSLFRSPAATAAAYIATRNPETLSYLHNLVRNRYAEIPSMYPIDEDGIKLNMINHLQRLGLSCLFHDEIKEISDDIYSQYNAQEASKQGLTQANIFKRSLAFEVLRYQGYNVSPRSFCNDLLKDESALQHIEHNYDMYTSMLYNLYRATNLMFDSEEEMQQLRSFSRRLLEKCNYNIKFMDDATMMWPHLQDTITRELLVPWMARMDHLDHREWIEANKSSPLFLGKASFYRISCLDDMNFLQLAKKNYEYRQLVYKKELAELLRWSKEWGISDMGFARDKTTYCYFAIASSSPLPYDTDIRLIVAKSAVIITIFDDFFDMEGSFDELKILAKAVKRWQSKGLRGQSKILFNVLDNFVGDTTKKYFNQHQIDITENLRKMWYGAVASWLTEATWSKTGEIPSMDSYMETGMISIAAHVLVLQASCFLTSSFSPHNLYPSQYETITKFLMTACRLLNDLQSYEKEVKDGKINSVLLHLKEKPDATMEGAIHHVENMLEENKKRLLEHALMHEVEDDMPRSFKMLHLHALKVFQMFFNSGNHFDSKESLLNEIDKAIFVPFGDDYTFFNPPNNPLKLPNSSQKKMPLGVNSHRYTISSKSYDRRTRLTLNGIPLAMSLGDHQFRFKLSLPYTFGFAC